MQSGQITLVKLGLSPSPGTAAQTRSIGRAEALRRAMLAYLNDLSNPRNAYPAYWAPFELVGDAR
jgi:CHAT domain-containing protein